MYKLVNGKLPINFDNILSSIIPDNRLNLRNASYGHLKVNFARTNFGEKMIQTGGVRLWNQIPRDIRDS